MSHLGRQTSTTDVEGWAQSDLPLDIPDAIRTGKDGQPCRQHRVQV